MIRLFKGEVSVFHPLLPPKSHKIKEFDYISDAVVLKKPSATDSLNLVAHIVWSETVKEEDKQNHLIELTQRIKQYEPAINLCIYAFHEIALPYSPTTLKIDKNIMSKQDDGYEKLTEDSSANSGAKFLRWFKPLLQALKDLGGSATPKDARKKIIENEKLTEEETSAVIGKTQTPEFNNDVAWARQYLVRGGAVGVLI